MSEFSHYEVQSFTESRIWQHIDKHLKTRLEAARLSLEDLGLTMDEVNIQRGVIRELRDFLFYVKQLTESVDLKPTDTGD